MPVRKGYDRSEEHWIFSIEQEPHTLRDGAKTIMVRVCCNCGWDSGYRFATKEELEREHMTEVKQHFGMPAK